MRLILQLLLLLLVQASAAESPVASELLSLLGFSTEEAAKLDRGEIIVKPAGEASDQELALSAALYLTTAPPKVIAYLTSGQLEGMESDSATYFQIPPDGGVESLDGFMFTEKQRDEVEDLLNVEPGDRFNLSHEEIEQFKSLKERLAGADEKTQAEAVNQLYRETLWRRWQSYRKEGLAGVAPYAHDKGSASSNPAAELRSAAENDKVLARYYPQLQKAWLKYPSDLPPSAAERFFGLNRRVESRPTAILGHRLIQKTEREALILTRHFFAGHSYNAHSLIIGCLPYREGSLVFYVQRIYTNQVAGVAAGLRHAIGREQMKSELVESLEALRKALEPQAANPPSHSLEHATASITR